MADKTFNVSIPTTYYNQCIENTWKGLVDDIPAFQKRGCAICALAAYKKLTLKQAYDKGVFTKTDPTVRTWLGATKTTPNIIKEYLSIRLLEEGRASIIHVTKDEGHYAVISGFKGTLPLDSRGKPVYLAVTPEMLLVTDSWEGRCKTYADLLKNYTSADFLFI